MVIAKMPRGRRVFVEKRSLARKRDPALVIVKAAQVLEDFELQVEEVLMPGKAGDYVVAGEESVPTVLSKKVFEKTYEQLTVGGAV